MTADAEREAEGQRGPRAVREQADELVAEWVKGWPGSGPPTVWQLDLTDLITRIAAALTHAHEAADEDRKDREASNQTVVELRDKLAKCEAARREGERALGEAQQAVRDAMMDRFSLTERIGSLRNVCAEQRARAESAERERDEAREMHRQCMESHGSTYGADWSNWRASERRAESAERALGLARAALEALLGSAVEFDDERVGYVVMQVDRVDIDAARALLAPPDAGKAGG
jgi:hypothetical protein